MCTLRSHDFHVPRSLLLCALSLWLTLSAAQALDPNNRLTQYGHVTWRIQDGFISAAPTAITQTTDGYLWIGTEDGLWRFDGARFVAWNPPAGQQYPNGSAVITSLYAAKDGSLWIGAASGLAHWANEKFTSIDAPTAAVEAIAEDPDGAIWITRAHMHNFSGPICRVWADKEHCYGESDGIRTPVAGPIAATAQGWFWIGTSGTLIEWKGRLIDEYPLPGGKGPDVTRALEGLAVETDGTVWAGVARVGTGNGLQRFVNGKWSTYTTSAFNGASLDVRALFLDQDDSLWIGTADRGVYRLHAGSVDHFGREDGLSGNSVRQIFQDQEGGIWIATNDGVDHFRDLPIVTYSSIEGLVADMVESVLARRDASITIATVRSVYSIRSSVITLQKLQSRLGGKYPTASLEDHNGNLWFGTNDGGLAAEVDGRLRVVLKGDSTGIFISLTESTDHAIWGVLAGSHARLIRIANFHVDQEFTPPQTPTAYCVVADLDGGVWLSALDGGLMHYQRGVWQKVSMEALTRKYSRGGGIYNLAVASDGTLWGAASGGVVGYRNGNLQLLNERNGLPCAATYSTISDRHNDLWIQARCGLVRIEHSELERWWTNPESRLKVATFTATEGFRPGIPYERPAITRTLDGKLWFHNRRVVQMIDPDNLAGNSVVPPVQVEQVIADRKIYSPHTRLRLPALTRDLEIDYTALSLAVPQKVQFRYKLEGYDRDWQDGGTRRQAFYGKLFPRNYTFRVRACNNSGLWNEAGASLDFSVLPAFYQTNWFRSLCAVGFLALLWGIYQLRVRQLQRQFNIGLESRVNERTRIARELHDTLLQNFHGLMFQFQAASNLLLRRPDEAKKSLDDAIIETKKAITESRNAIQGLRSEPIAKGNLGELLMSTSRELADANGSEHQPVFDLIEEGERRTLSPTVSNDICRTALEIIRNAYQHAHARRIEAEIRYGDSMFRLRIRDDGQGIEPKVLKEGGRLGHWGLRGVRERADRIGARLEVWSEPGNGTEVQLLIPAAIAYESFRDSYRAKWFQKAKSRAKRS
jgi:signal transduction histidine kinase/ligand-binding sensor domain-containing protein